MNRPLPQTLPVAVPALRPTAPRQPRPMMRRYDIQYLTPTGQAASLTKIAPCTRSFEETCMAFARGTLIAAPSGQIAVEDLIPGDTIETVEHGPQTVLWIGSTTVVPGAPGQSVATGTLTRIAADGIGFGRPTQDITLGFAARVFRPERGPLPDRLEPIASLVDGIATFEITPPSAVQVFHIALRRHARLIACGIELESYHPGAQAATLLRGEIRALYLSLFPHLSGLEAFGPLCLPRGGGGGDAAPY
ncbi:MAG: Hint domain-containing protein [Shimia sp.]